MEGEAREVLSKCGWSRYFGCGKSILGIITLERAFPRKGQRECLTMDHTGSINTHLHEVEIGSNTSISTLEK